MCDLGSGAGLPGLVLAIARPDLRVTLVEPLLRRTTFLDEVVADLGLESVEVVRGRAEELHGERTVRRGDLAGGRARWSGCWRWSMPLVAPDGALVAMKGSSVGEEIEAAAAGRWTRLPVCASREVLDARRRSGWSRTDHGRSGWPGPIPGG